MLLYAIYYKVFSLLTRRFSKNTILYNDVIVDPNSILVNMVNYGSLFNFEE